jgi:hypothetical protein
MGAAKSDNPLPTLVCKELGCLCCWNGMNFFKDIFETVFFIRSMPYTSCQRSQALEGGVKELII